jgi:hypothetical protein
MKPKYAMKPEYEYDTHSKYLVLRIRSSGLKKRIPIEELNKFACDHDYLVSDDERCWDCGKIKPYRHSPTNWALPRIR